MFKMFNSSSGLSLCSRMGRRYNGFLSRVVVVTCPDHRHSLVIYDKVSSCGNSSSRRVNMVVQQQWSMCGSYTWSLMRKDVRGMSVLGMKRFYSTSDNDNNGNDQDNNKNDKKRSNNTSDDRKRSMNTGYKKENASTSNDRIGNWTNDHNSNRKMNSQDKTIRTPYDKTYHDHNHQAPLHSGDSNRSSSQSSKKGGGGSRQPFIKKELFSKPFKHDAINNFIDTNIRDMNFRTIAFLMQTSSNEEHRLSLQNLRLIITALKSDYIASDLIKIESDVKMKGFSQLMHSLNLYTDKDDGIIDLIPVVTELLKNSGIKLGSQAVGNMFYGMQGMNSDTPEVIELLKVMIILAKACKEDLSAQAVGNMFLGLKNMNSDKPEVIELLKVMTKLAKTCKEDLSAQAVGNMIYGMQGMSSDNPEVIELLKVLTKLAKTCKQPLIAQDVGMMFYGIQGMSGDNPEVIELLKVLTRLAKTCKQPLIAQEVGMMFYGMQGMSSDNPEVIELLKVLTGLAKTCDEDLDAQAVGNMFYGMQGMSSDNPVVIELLKVLTKLAKTCNQPLPGQEVGNTLYGLQGMSSSSDDVQSLLIVLAPMVTSCTEPLSPQQVSNALFGLIPLFDESNISIMDIFRFLQSHYRRTISETEASSSFDDAMMLTSNVCYFDYFLRKKGVSEQLSRELQDMKTGLERLELLGLKAGKASCKVSRSEKLYVELFRKVLEKNSRYEVKHQWYIDGIECDIIIIDSSNGNIIANIEIDGVYHSKPRRQRLTKLRDEYLSDHHRIRVERVNVMMVRVNQEIVDTDVKRVLKNLDIDMQV